MDDARALPPGGYNRPGLLVVVIALFVLLLTGRFFASTLLDYEWWKEIHQLDTWFSQLLYGSLPVFAIGLLLFACYAIAWRLGLRRVPVRGSFAGSPWGSRLILFAILALAFLIADGIIDSWKIVRFFGGLRIPGAGSMYTDPIFGHSLGFYFFSLPFYETLLNVLLAASLGSLLIFWLVVHFEDVRQSFTRYSTGFAMEHEPISFGGAFDSAFVRIALAVLLIALGIHFYFGRFELLLADHGQFLLGVDYLADHVVLPLQWMLIAAAFLGAVLVLIGRGKMALLLLLVLPIRYLVPPILSSIYVRPNELALERPYIAHHIQATRSAYGVVGGRLKETSLDAQAEIPIDYAKHKPLLENVRLWDWRAFHDTVSQIQPLRPFGYFDTDIDRYQIQGSLRQVLLTPRELDVQQLGEARNRWINPHLIYTHGYGMVMAGANSITTDGLPKLMVLDAPPKVNVPGLRFERPEIYYGEVAQEPVYVSTAQPEFDYPGADEHGHAHYGGTGGFPVSSFFLRLAAMVRYADPNVLLTNYLQPGSRMMIHRQIIDRLSTQAGFLDWDSDPYLMLTDSGRLVWIVDGYMSSASHPYSRELRIEGIGTVNYIRNSVKATVDAYSGETHLYVFDPSDPLIAAYRQLFPHLLEPASAIPRDVRAHLRYPETLFAAQAEIYRAFHMRDPEAFYNRADLWDIARTSTGNQDASSVRPTYVVATLPGQDSLEFLLITPFTPANKDNLIGMMVARCDGEHLGELQFQQLGKQNIVYGPKQIEAFITQDQTISKDLTLWNQQGSEVLRGQILVLPIENSFLYVEPIYIQASGARMPQLKKVALAMGDRLAYADTYQQALTQLIAATAQPGAPPPSVPTAGQAPAETTAAPLNPSQVRDLQTLQDLRDHFQRYRDLNSQGKYAEAGKELETIQKLLGK